MGFSRFWRRGPTLPRDDGSRVHGALSRSPESESTGLKDGLSDALERLDLTAPCNPAPAISPEETKIAIHTDVVALKMADASDCAEPKKANIVDYGEGRLAQSLIPVFIINLEQDAERKLVVLAQFDALPAFLPSIINGVPGGLLPQAACVALVRDPEWAWQRGTIGCFISHVKAWEAVADSKAPFAVVLEDDTDVGHLAALPAVKIPADAELIFINERMSAHLEGKGQPVALPLLYLLKRLEALRGGLGGDGYLLTPAGATKLLAACTEDSYFGHVDGRLLQYATSESDLALLPPSSWIETVIRDHRHPTLPPRLGLLRSYCLSMPLVSHRGMASRREAENRAPPPVRSTARAQPLEARQANTLRTGPGSPLPLRYWNRIDNVGDSINPFVIEAITGRPPFFSANPVSDHVLGIGSIFFMATPASFIWGSGILDPTADYGHINIQRVFAVRGTATRDLLRSKYGLTGDIPTGDPGIFANEIPEIARADRRVTKRRFGIVPHYSMINNPYLHQLAAQADCALISPRLPPIEFLTELLASEIIISQALHGIIFAQLFDKPYVWLSHSDSATWLFKFHDWFSNVADAPETPVPFGAEFDKVIRGVRSSTIRVDREALRSSMPDVQSTSRTSGISFRDRGSRQPLFCLVTQGKESSLAPRFDTNLVCDLGDERSLQFALQTFGSRFDDQIPSFLIFDKGLLDELHSMDMRAILGLLTDFPDVHYIIFTRFVISEIISMPTQGRARVADRKLDLVPATPSEFWQGIVLVRHPVNFSFQAPGLVAIFRQS